CCNALDYLSNFATIDRETLCMHSRPSPDMHAPPNLHLPEVLCEGAFCGKAASRCQYPNDLDNWTVNPRDAGWLFGGNVTREALFQ
ncbi:hypothetical protein EDD16DRAFT_1491577, partial [Pisolithus croceorrhizus]